MTTTTLPSRTRRPLARVCLGLATVLVALGTLTLASAPAGAAEGCGTYSYGFSGTRLLNDGISNTAGPFPADIPAGTYTVTLVSHDHHDTQVDVPSQTGEQYHVVLNSGYVSPPSTDIPDSITTMTTTFTGQVIGNSTTISVKHAGAPGINSVDVLCVGFTPEAVVDATVEPTVEKPPAPPAALEQPPATTPVAEPTPTPNPVVEAPAPEPTTVPVVAVPEVIEPEVKGVIETPAPPIAQLAITGPSTEAVALISLGLALIIIGGLLIREEKRFS